jgi:hypothetical protein
MRPITPKKFICKGCGKDYIRSGYNQKYCGRQYDTGTCSFIRKRSDPYKKVYTKGYNKKNYAYINNPQYKFKAYNRSASRRSKKFELTFKEFMGYWQRPCSYCGDTIAFIGLDRVDNNLGYTLDNIVSCCNHCNYMKGRLSREEFLLCCRRVVKFIDS